MSRRPLITLGGVWAGLWASGCLATGVDLSAASKNGTPVNEIEKGAPLEPTMSRAYGGPVQFAYPAPQGGILVSTDRSIAYLPKSGDAIELGSAPGAVTAAAAIGSDQTLIAAKHGLFVFSAGKLDLSPLTQALRRMPPTDLLSMPREDGALELWIAGPGSLHLWQAGRLNEVRPDDLPVSNAQLAYGAPRGADMPAWVASDGVLYAISSVSGGSGPNRLQAYRELEGRDLGGAKIDAIAADVDGALWVAAGGLLRKRPSDGSWQTFHEPRNVTELRASADAHDLWIHAEDGIWHHREGLLRRVNGVPSGRLLSITAEGSVLVGADSGLFLVEAGRRVELTGIGDGGAVINAPIVVEIHPEQAEKVSEVSAILDGTATALERPWQLTLNPAQLTEGDHTLEIEVTYTDTSILGRAKIRFRHTRAPTWGSDISKLYMDRCAICHSPSGYSHPLNTAALWRADIDRIIEAVRTQKMPLPPNRPLDAAQIELIQAWRSAGLPD